MHRTDKHVDSLTQNPPACAITSQRIALTSRSLRHLRLAPSELAQPRPPSAREPFRPHHGAYINRPPSHNLSTPAPLPLFSSPANTIPPPHYALPRRNWSRSSRREEPEPSTEEVTLQATSGDAASTCCFPVVDYTVCPLPRSSPTNG